MSDIMKQLEEVRKIFAIEKELRTIKNRGYFPVPQINPKEEKIETTKDKDKILDRIDEIATAMIQAARQSEENLAREQDQVRARDQQLRSVRQTDRSGLNFFTQANSTPVRNNNSRPDNQGVHFKTNPTHHIYSTTSDDNDPYEPPENDSLIQTASPPQTDQLTTSTTKPMNHNKPWRHNSNTGTTVGTVTHRTTSVMATDNIEVQLQLKDEKLANLQESDPHIRQLRKQWDNNNLDTASYTIENNILKWKIIDNGLLYTPIIVPDILKDYLLILAHDKQGHNRFRRMYASLRNKYHWKGMKKSIHQHCSRCQVCAKHNIKTQQLKNEHFSSPPQPMEFIAMDLIGEFHPASSKGNRYALTAVCMLTGFTFCIPLKSKRAEDVIRAYIDHICCTFGLSRKILTENGTEFKNKLWTEVFEKLKIEQKFTPIYSPQCNGRIEGFHKFLKATIAKQLEPRVEWDYLVWKATAAYNFFPTESSGITPFFLMFGREAAVKHTLLESENPKYLGTDDGMINIGLMTELYHIVSHNLNEVRKARDGNKKSTKPKEPVVLRVGDNVLVRDHTSKAFQQKYKDFCIVGLLGKNQIEIKDNHGHITKVHHKDVKKIPMTEKVCQLYEEEQLGKTREGRKAVPDNKMPE